MSRPDPIEYAERLYTAIRVANFSPISFLAFGNAVKEGVSMRNMPRIAVEPFMRVVGEMLDLEEEAARAPAVDAEILDEALQETPGSRSEVETPANHDVRVAGDSSTTAVPAKPEERGERRRKAPKS